MQKLNERKSILLITALLFSLFVGFISISLISYGATKDYVTGNTIKQSLPLISDNIYSEIKEELLDPINVSSLMSNDTFLINWVENGETNLDDIQQYLERIHNSYGYETTFFVSDRTKNYYYYNGILKKISMEDIHDLWYYKFVELNQPIDLDVDYDEAHSGKLTVFINNRLEDTAGNFLGVAGVGIELSNIGEKFIQYQEKYDHEIYLVDEKGVIQIHSNPSFVERKNLLDRKSLTNIPAFSLDPDQGIQVYEYTDNGEIHAISIRYIPEFHWFLIIEKNQTESLRSARLSLWKNIIIGICITGVVALLMIGNLKMYYRKLEFLATTDDLTKMYNRRYFNELFIREITIATRYKRPLSLLLMDVDNFKEINDQYGHLVGDDMLRMVSEKIKSAIRSTDIVGRWGGEEFVVLLLNSDIHEAAQTAERIRETVESSILNTDFGELSRTISIGISTLDEENASDDSMTRTADNALYEAKNKGKNNIVY